MTSILQMILTDNKAGVCGFQVKIGFWKEDGVRYIDINSQSYRLDKGVKYVLDIEENAITLKEEA